MYCVYLLFAITQISIFGVSTLSIPPNHTLPLNASGFSTKIEFGKKPLSDLGVYINAVGAIREWSRDTWDSEFKGTIGVVDSQLGIAIRCVEIVQPIKGPSMQMGHVLLGLQSGVVAMAERNQFQEMVVFLQFHGVVRGVIEFTQRLRFDVPSDSPSNSSVLEGGNLKDPRSLMEDSGQVYDPNHRYHWLSIDWRFDGQTMLPSETFTTIIDAMISTASGKPDAQRSHIHGVSSSGNTAFNIHSLQYISPGARSLTNDLIRESLYLIARYIFIKERKFLETDFTVLSFGKKIAEGFFMKISGVQGNQTVPTASQKRNMMRRMTTSPKI